MTNYQINLLLEALQTVISQSKTTEEAAKTLDQIRENAEEKSPTITQG